MSKKTLVSLSKYDSKTSISNANWENTISQPIKINEGDTIAIKSSFIDTRNRKDNNIIIDQDTTIELSYYFYYINRGGCPIKSQTNNPQFPNRQMLCNEYIYSVSTFPQSEGTMEPNAPTININPASMKDKTLPLTDDTTATGKIEANLTPLTESIYHTISNYNINNLKNQVYTKDGKFDSHNFLNNPSGFHNTQDINTPDALPYILTYYKPENVNKNFIPEDENINTLVIGDKYSIKNLGQKLFDNSYDTNFINLSSTLTNPTLNENFTLEHTNVNLTTADYTLITKDNTIIITNSLGFDYSLVNGPSLPDSSSNPFLSLQVNITANLWFKYISLTPRYVDGSVIPDYFYFTGVNNPDLQNQYIAMNPSNITTYPSKLPILKTSLPNINIGMTIEVINQGLIDWDSMGYKRNTPTDISPFDITNATLNIPFRIISQGLTFGSNNQYNQLDLPLNNDNDIFEPTALITPKEITFNVIDTNQLTDDLVGEFFYLTDLGTLTPTEWATLSDFPYGIQQWTIFELKHNPTTPLSGGKIQHINLIMPIGTIIQINDIGNGEVFFEKIGYTQSGVRNIITTNENGDVIFQEIVLNNNGDKKIFTTNAVITLDLIAEIAIPEPAITLSFSFINPETKIQNYNLITPFTFIVNEIYTYDDYTNNNNNWTANLVKTDTIQQITNYNFPIPQFKPSKAIEYNIIGSTPVFNCEILGSAIIAQENDKSNDYNKDYLNAPKMVPFIKKYKQLIKRGSYTPDYLAEIISRGMSIQKSKINKKKTGEFIIQTPIQNINSQFYKQNPNIFYGPNPPPEQAFYNPPNLENGSFPYLNQPIDNSYYLNYQPNLYFNPKNKNILPKGDNLNQNTIPINPVYTALDFNNEYNDDMPFLFRPNAYTTLSSETVNYPEVVSRPDNLIPNIPPQNIPNCQVKLVYNDYNLDNFNDIEPFGNGLDNSIKNIEMAYRPLCNDVKSSYYQNLQTKYNIPNTNDYSIRPVISCPIASLNYFFSILEFPPGFNFNVATGSFDITSPIVGAPLMNLSYNLENNGIFSFSYMHTPIYSKPDITTSQVVESIGMYPTTYINNTNNQSYKAVCQIESQSGILFENMTATNADGSVSDFWTKLGFDVDAITHKYDPEKPNDFNVPYETFLQSTTRGFSGSANIYDNQQTSAGLSEISPISYIDSLSIAGWMTGAKNTFTLNPESNQFTSGYTLYNKILYYAVDTTESVNAVSLYTDPQDVGHYLISLDGYNLNLYTENNKLAVKTIVSSYYSSSNFITNSAIDSAIYEHIGESIYIDTMKVVIINPYTGKEMLNIGANSSLYLEITQALSKNNVIDISMDN